MSGCVGDEFQVCFSSNRLEKLEKNNEAVRDHIKDIRDTNNRLFELYRDLDVRTKKFEDTVIDYIQFKTEKTITNGNTSAKLEDIEKSTAETDKELCKRVDDHDVKINTMGADIEVLKESAKDMKHIKYLLFTIIIGFLLNTFVFKF